LISWVSLRVPNGQMTSYDGKTKNKSNLNRFIYMFFQRRRRRRSRTMNEGEAAAEKQPKKAAAILRANI